MRPEPLYDALKQRAITELLRRSDNRRIKNRDRRHMDGVFDEVIDAFVEPLTEKEIKAFIAESADFTDPNPELRSKIGVTTADHVRWNLREALTTALETALRVHERTGEKVNERPSGKGPGRK